MKKYAGLVPIVMILIVLGSWYKMISGVASTQDEYESYITAAKEAAKSGVTKTVIENYKKALAVKSTPEVYAGMADYYFSQEDERKYVSTCATFLEEFPTDKMAYEYAAKAYATKGDYEEFFTVIETARKRNIKSDALSEIAAEHAYEYYLDFDLYDDVGVFSNYLSPVCMEEKWGYVNRFGKVRAKCQFVSAGVYTNTGKAPVRTEDGHAYFLDDEGDKILAQEQEVYLSFGPISDGRIAAEVSEGVFGYVDESLNLLYSGYEYAGTYNGGIAAVKEGENYYVIDDNGNKLSSAYADVKVDGKGIAFRNDRLFVATKEGQYIMVDSSFNQVGSDVYQDAFVFNSADSYTAVEVNGEWFFIDKNGERKSDKKYGGARAYANGLAAVEIDGFWGFVDDAENLVIACEYHGAKDFNEKGSCFVNVGSGWKLLKVYRLNR